MEEPPDLLADLLAAEEVARPPADVARDWLEGRREGPPDAIVAEIATRLPPPDGEPRPWTWIRERADAEAIALVEGLRQEMPGLRVLLTTEASQARLLSEGPDPRTAAEAAALGPQVRADDALPFQSAGWRRHGGEAPWQALALAFAPGQRMAGEAHRPRLDLALDAVEPEAMDAFLRLHEAAHAVLRAGPAAAKIPEGARGVLAEEIVCDAAALAALRPEIGDARADALAGRVAGYRDAAMVGIGDALHWTAPALRAARDEIRATGIPGDTPARRLVAAVAWSAARLVEEQAWPMPDEAAWRRRTAAGEALAAGRRPRGLAGEDAADLAAAIVGAAAHARAIEVAPPRTPHADAPAETARHLRAAHAAQQALLVAVHRREAGAPHARRIAGHLCDAARTAGAPMGARTLLRALALDGDAPRFAAAAVRLDATGLGGWLGRARDALETEARIAEARASGAR